MASAQADIVNAEAGLAFSTQEAKRYADLLTSGAGTSQRAQQTDADLRQHRATLDKDRAALDAAQKQVHTYEALAASAVAGIASAQAKLDGAELNLGYATVRAPVDGVVGDRSVRVGQMVQSGMGLLTVVPMGRDIYLVANFKETQLGDMAVGQPVEFTVDAFGDHAFRGTVDSFSPGTGAQFALLPPENATGNFTKVVQRVPVKIRLATDDADARPPAAGPVGRGHGGDARRQVAAEPQPSSAHWPRHAERGAFRHHASSPPTGPRCASGSPSRRRSSAPLRPSWTSRSPIRR